MKQSGQEGQNRHIAAMNHRLIYVSWYWGDCHCTMWWSDLSALCASRLVKIIFKWRRHVFHWKWLPGIMCINTLTILSRTRLHPSVEGLCTFFNRIVDWHRCNLQLNYCTDSYDLCNSSLLCSNTWAVLAAMLCLKCGKEMIRFLRKSKGSSGHRRRQDEVSSATDWTVGNSLYQLPHKLGTLRGVELGGCSQSSVHDG